VIEARTPAEHTGWPRQQLIAAGRLRRPFRQTHRYRDAEQIEAEYETPGRELSEVPATQAERFLPDEELDAEQAREDGREDEAVEPAERALSMPGTAGQGHEDPETRARRTAAGILDGRGDPAAELGPHLRRLLHLYQDLDPTALPPTHC
jgi:hypothetical protein